MEVNLRAFKLLRKNFNNVTILDIGCAEGSFFYFFFQHSGFQRQEANIIGIDAIIRGNAPKIYNIFLNYAVDNIDNLQTKQFFRNKGDDRASSLLLMDFDNLTDDKNNKEKIYIPWSKALSIGNIDNVQVLPMFKIIEQLNLLNTQYQFCKIDTEGNDLQVTKSFRNYINNVYFITLECSSHKNKNIRIFKNGSQKEEVIEYMNSIGFSIFDCADYEQDKTNGTQMSDICFCNNQKMRELHE
jgi:hypothetical protein